MINGPIDPPGGEGLGNEPLGSMYNPYDYNDGIDPDGLCPGRGGGLPHSISSRSVLSGFFRKGGFTYYDDTILFCEYCGRPWFG